MKIAVICGGLSAERDVSISTGTGAAAALRSKGHSVALVDLFLGNPEYILHPEKAFTVETERKIYAVKEEEPDLQAIRESRGGREIIGPGVLEVCRSADIVFLALHGAEGENGKLQALLDLYGVPYTGSGYLGSAVAMNKQLSKICFEHSGIPTPDGVLLTKGEEVPEITLPCVVKPCSGGSSVGTSIVRSSENLSKALYEAFACEDKVLVEKYIQGRELTVGVLDGKAMPVIEIIPKTGFYDYKNKYQAGLTEEICPAPITPEQTAEIQALAEKVYAALGLQAYGRVDFLLDETEGVFYCLEANTLPGMTPTSLIPQMALEEGMDYATLCEKIIEASFKKYQD